jgi:hypothetical protein
MVPDKGELLLQQRHEGDGIEDTAALGESYGAVFFFFPSFTSDKKFSLLLTIQRRGIFD